MARTYYYGACVDFLSSESDTTDNCSSGYAVRVAGPGDAIHVGLTDFGISVNRPTGLAAIGSTLYMVGAGVGAGNNGLYTVNTSTGRATRVGFTPTLGVGEGGRGLAAIGNTLYGGGEQRCALHSEHQHRRGHPRG